MLVVAYGLDLILGVIRLENMKIAVRNLIKGVAIGFTGQRILKCWAALQRIMN